MGYPLIGAAFCALGAAVLEAGFEGMDLKDRGQLWVVVRHAQEGVRGWAGVALDPRPGRFERNVRGARGHLGRVLRPSLPE